MSDQGGWLISREARPTAAFRLYCFPYAGGTSGEYVRWADELPDVEVWGVVPPGRGERLGETPFAHLDELVPALVGEVRFEAPFVLFGHSLGAVASFEVARALRAAGLPGPEFLVVSGHRPPHLPLVDERIHHLPPAEFRAIVRERYPQPPPELAEDEELYAEILETLRSDLSLFETYEYRPGPPLDCPIVVVSGVDDHWTADDLRPWRRHTTSVCPVHLIEGDHFYLPDRRDQVIRIIAETLRAGSPA